MSRALRSDGAVAALVVAALAGLAALLVGCVAEAPPEVRQVDARFTQLEELPPPDAEGAVALETALAGRRSRRSFSSGPLDPGIVGQLLWAGQGITDGAGHRTAPSAGARYPLELYVLTGARFGHYLPDRHALELRDAAVRGELAELAFGQGFVADAPVVLVIAGVVARSEAEYGAVAPQLVDREAGHAAQNVLLQAEALGLAATPVGGFDPVAVRRSLGLPPTHDVLYLIPVGRRPVD